MDCVRAGGDSLTSAEYWLYDFEIYSIAPILKMTMLVRNWSFVRDPSICSYLNPLTSLQCVSISEGLKVQGLKTFLDTEALRPVDLPLISRPELHMRSGKIIIKNLALYARVYTGHGQHWLATIWNCVLRSKPLQSSVKPFHRIQNPKIQFKPNLVKRWLSAAMLGLPPQDILASRGAYGRPCHCMKYVKYNAMMICVLPCSSLHS